MFAACAPSPREKLGFTIQLHGVLCHRIGTITARSEWAWEKPGEGTAPEIEKLHWPCCTEGTMTVKGGRGEKEKQHVLEGAQCVAVSTVVWELKWRRRRFVRVGGISIDKVEDTEIVNGFSF